MAVSQTCLALAGYTTLGIALGLQPGGKVYALDISKDFPEIGMTLMRIWSCASHAVEKVDMQLLGPVNRFVFER